MEKIRFKDSKGHKLVGEFYSPIKPSDKLPLVVYSHGLYSSMKSNKSAVFRDKLPAAGFGFFVFDAYGVGESEGKFKETTLTSRIDGLKSAIDTVSSRDDVLTNKVYLVGSSFGGLASLCVAAQNDKVKAMVLLAPAVNFCYKNFEPTEYPELDSTAFEDVRKYDPYKVAEKIKIPVLIIHGDKDEEVPFETSIELVKHIKNAKLVTIEGADHRFDNKKDFDLLVEKTVNFLITVSKKRKHYS